MSKASGKTLSDTVTWHWPVTLGNIFGLQALIGAPTAQVCLFAGPVDCV